MKRTLIKAIAIFSVVCITINTSAITAIANPSLQEQINSNNAEKAELQNQKSQVEREVEEMQGQINEQMSKLEKAKADVKFYQDKIDLLQNDINTIEQNVLKSEDQIQLKQSLIEEKGKMAEEANEIMDERVRSYYKTGGASQYLYMIINSDSIMEVAQNIIAVTRLINLDKDLIDECKTIQKELTREIKLVKEQLEQLERDRVELEDKKTEVVDAQKEFLVIRDEEQNQMNQLNSMENEKRAKIESFNGKIANIANENEALQAELDRITSNSNNGNQPTTPSESGFIRPVNGYVSSPFGPRNHPITGAYTFHKGVDFANGYGTQIKASKSGIVSYSGWMSGYGKVIIINHGNGEQTVYAHQQALYVSEGQSVSQGQAIGEVGSTGDSTGPHLHFEIRINGSCVDPMKYM